jgi:lsr operon transcriptional repressor
LQRRGAVGDICFQFIDKDGAPVQSPLMQRVIGIDLATLKRARRVVGIAGGADKVPVILACLRGQWINVLITERKTAERLIDLDLETSKDSPSKSEGARHRGVSTHSKGKAE